MRYQIWYQAGDDPEWGLWNEYKYWFKFNAEYDVYRVPFDIPIIASRVPMTFEIRRVNNGN